jgi:hypothetical protein
MCTAIIVLLTPYLIVLGLAWTLHGILRLEAWAFHHIAWYWRRTWKTRK